jgi:hypothetical protein
MIEALDNCKVIVPPTIDKVGSIQINRAIIPGRSLSTKKTTLQIVDSRTDLETRTADLTPGMVFIYCWNECPSKTLEDLITKNNCVMIWYQKSVVLKEIKAELEKKFLRSYLNFTSLTRYDHENEDENGIETEVIDNQIAEREYRRDMYEDIVKCYKQLMINKNLQRCAKLFLDYFEIEKYLYDNTDTIHQNGNVLKGAIYAEMAQRYKKTNDSVEKDYQRCKQNQNSVISRLLGDCLDGYRAEVSLYC